MKLTEEQKNAIAKELAERFSAIVDDPIEDYDALDFDEDEYGHTFSRGKCTLCGEIDEICIDGLPGLDTENSEVSICASYYLDISYYDDYDSGDYWTPPSGGVELDNVTGAIESVDIDAEVYNPQAEEWEVIEVTEEEVALIIKKVHNLVFGL